MSSLKKPVVWMSTKTTLLHVSSLQKERRLKTFSTKTVFLIQLVDWIKEHRCTHVAMESTSVYWKPIVNLLEAEDIEFLVVNAQHIKAVPGRKTDVKMLNGLPNYYATVYSELVLYQTESNESYVNLFVIVEASLKSVLDNIIGFKKF
ncbi:Transposase [Halobacillus karajensis]|nr:Transposase [Halobacillus karajensis]